MRRWLTAPLRLHLLAVVAGAMLPIVALLVVGAQGERRAAIDAARGDAMRIVRFIAIEQRSVIAGVRQLLTGLAGIPALRSADAVVCDAQLAALLAQFPVYANIGVVMPDGTLACSAVPFRRPLHVGGDVHIQRAFATRAFAVGEYAISAVIREPTLAFAAPAGDATGGVAAVVFVELQLTGLRRLAALSDLPGGAVLSIVDRNATVLVRYPNSEAWVGQRAPDSPAVRAVFAGAGDGVTEVRGEDGRPHLIAFAPLPADREGVDAYAILEIPQHVALAAANRAFRRDLIALLVVLLLACAASWNLGTRGILNPIHALIAATGSVAGGDLRVRIRLRTTSGEFATLARSFNTMADALERRDAAITRAAATLRAEKAQDDAILASIGDGLLVVDQRGRPTLVNRAAERMLGWRAASIAAHPPEAIFQGAGGASLSPAEVPWHAARMRHGETGGSYQCVRADGSTFPVAVSASPVLLDDAVMGAVIVFRDVTQERAVDRAKTEFVSIASHQLRTPLTTLRWYIEMLLDGDVGVLRPKQRMHLREIARATERMAALVAALLELSRLELGTGAKVAEPIDLRAVVADVLREFTHTIAEKKLHIVHHDDGARFVQGDPRLLRIVVANLLDNAVKYTPADGHVRIGVTSKAGAVILTVADTGCGIPPDEQPQLFTKFFRASNARIQEPDGNGIGLTIVRSILDRMGGTVTFVSAAGKGTTFTVRIPIQT